MTNKQQLFTADDLVNDPFSVHKINKGRLILHNICISIQKGMSIDDEYVEHVLQIPMFAKEWDAKVKGLQDKADEKNKSRKSKSKK